MYLLSAGHVIYGVESLIIELCSVLAGISVHKRVDSEDSEDIVDFDTSCQFQAKKKRGQNNTRLK